MAYVNCEHCGRRAFTTAYWSNIDYCDHCGHELPHPRSVVEMIVSRGADEVAAQAN